MWAPNGIVKSGQAWPSRASLTSILLLALLLPGIAGGQPVAHGLSLRGEFSGAWHNPDQPGQGLQIDIIDERRATVIWYAFDDQGNAMWLLGVGRLSGNTITATLRRFTGAFFPPAFDPADVLATEWGEVTLEFDDCNNGRISWRPAQPGFADGAMPIVRLTGIDGFRCGQSGSAEMEVNFNLDTGPSRWEALFAEFAVSQEELIEAEAVWEQVPEPLNDRFGFKLAGSNRSDDLAMFIKHPVGGLLPGVTYSVGISMTFATRVPRMCAGIGGPPGEGVFVKLGAATGEPAAMAAGDGPLDRIQLNVDIGNQSQSGRNAAVAGDVTNSQLCPPNAEGTWELKTVAIRNGSLSVNADPDGRLWVFVGSDSGFEGRTEFYITRVQVRLSPARLLDQPAGG